MRMSERKAINLLILVGLLMCLTLCSEFGCRLWERHGHTVCVSRLMLIREVFHRYADEHAGAYPSTLLDLVPQYLDSNIIHCPVSGEQYLYCRGVLSDDPPDLPIVVDAVAVHKRGHANALLKNGIVWTICASELAAIRQSPWKACVVTVWNEETNKETIVDIDRIREMSERLAFPLSDFVPAGQEIEMVPLLSPDPRPAPGERGHRCYHQIKTDTDSRIKPD